MKKKDLNETKSKALAQIVAKIVELEKQKVETHVQLKMAKVKNVHTFARIKKDIAQFKTIARIKTLAEKLKEVGKEEKANAS